MIVNTFLITSTLHKLYYLLPIKIHWACTIIISILYIRKQDLRSKANFSSCLSTNQLNGYFPVLRLDKKWKGTDGLCFSSNVTFLHICVQISKKNHASINIICINIILVVFLKNIDNPTLISLVMISWLILPNFCPIHVNWHSLGSSFS